MTDTLHRTAWAAADHQDPADLHLERRRLVGQYLKDREAFEDGTGIEDTYRATREALVHALIACGEYTDDATARAEVDALNAGFAAERLVERWAHREALLTEMSTRQVNAIADRVRDRVAEGKHLDDLGMWEIAAPYLGVEL